MHRRSVLIAIVGISIISWATRTHAQPSVVTVNLPTLAADRTPGVDVWLENDFLDPFTDAKAYFNAAPGSYVTVVRVTPRNTLEVLYPANPGNQHPYVRSAEARTAIPFHTDGKEGLGLVYAISSDTPFDYSRVSSSAGWNGDRLSNPIGATIPEIAGYFFNEILPAARLRYTMAQAPYVNGGATFRLGDPGFPTVSSIIDAAGLACAWSGTDTQGRICEQTAPQAGVNTYPSSITGHPTPLEQERALAARCRSLTAGNGRPECAGIIGDADRTKPKIVPPPPPPPPPPSED